MVKGMMALLGSAALAVSSAALALPVGATAAAPVQAASAAGLLRTAPPTGFGSSGSGTRNSTFLSTNWAGFVEGVSVVNGQPVVGSDTFDGVYGSWKVPVLVSPRRGDVGTWMGLGGVNGNLLQVGTEDLWVHGRPEAFAFWEEVPGGPAQLVARVPMGAEVGGSIQPQFPASSNLGRQVGSSPSDWLLTLVVGRGSSARAVISQEVPASSFMPDESTAEWITEDPTCLPSGRLCPFASFLPVQFNSVVADQPVISSDSQPPPFARVLIVSPSGRPKVEVSPASPTSLPSDFTVTRVDAWGAPVLSPSPWGPGGPLPRPWGRFPGFPPRV